jgi:hypothetical protein
MEITMRLYIGMNRAGGALSDFAAQTPGVTFLIRTACRLRQAGGASL